MRYAVGDIHGMSKLFFELMGKLNLTQKDRVYILGDAMDRGKDGIEVLQYIMKQENMIYILGNHDDVFLTIVKNINEYNIDTVEKLSTPSEYPDGVVDDLEYYRYSLYGESTLKDYLELTPEEQESIVKYLGKAQLWQIDDRFILVHAGYRAFRIDEAEAESVLKMQRRHDLLWVRERFFLSRGLEGYITVFGHTVARTIPSGKRVAKGEVWRSDNGDKIGIDTGACFEGVLTAICLDTGEIIQVGKE